MTVKPSIPRPYYIFHKIELVCEKKLKYVLHLQPLAYLLGHGKTHVLISTYKTNEQTSK